MSQSDANPFIWLPPAPLARELFALGRERKVSRGEIVHGIGARSDAIYLILEGKVRMMRMSPSGRALMLTMLYPGSWFGDLNALIGEARTDDAIAQTPGRLLYVPRSRFLALLKERSDLQMLLLKALGHRLRLALDEIENAQFLGLGQRIARRLLALQVAQDTCGEGHLPLPLTQQMIADMVGVTRENAARVLGGWRRAGHVSSQRGMLTVHDFEALCRLAGLPAARVV